MGKLEGVSAAPPVEIRDWDGERLRYAPLICSYASCASLDRWFALYGALLDRRRGGGEARGEEECVWAFLAGLMPRYDGKGGPEREDPGWTRGPEYFETLTQLVIGIAPGLLGPEWRDRLDDALGVARERGLLPPPLADHVGAGLHRPKVFLPGAGRGAPRSGFLPEASLWDGTYF